MPLRKLNRRVLRAGFRCPCVFELGGSQEKNERSRSILGLHLRERERVSRRIRCRALQEEVRVTGVALI